jgi:hypothetical protein
MITIPLTRASGCRFVLFLDLRIFDRRDLADDDNCMNELQGTHELPSQTRFIRAHNACYTDQNLFPLTVSSASALGMFKQQMPNFGGSHQTPRPTNLTPKIWFKARAMRIKGRTPKFFGSIPHSQCSAQGLSLVPIFRNQFQSLTML